MAVPGREPMEQPEREETRRPFGTFRPEGMGYFDIVRWGPVFGGVFTAMAIMMMLSFLGVAIGLSTVGQDGLASVVAPAIWTIISLILGLFFGGWLASATSGITGLWDGVFHGIVVWGLTMIFFALAIGFGLGGLFGAFGLVDTATLAGTAWGLFFASLLGLVASVIGGIVGSSREATYRAR